jgi:D-alanyl-D-alanine carboxypeptidase
MRHLTIELYIIIQLLLGAPLDVLITKDQGLPHWYAPGESEEAALALGKMTSAANDEGIHLWINSGYRNFNYQTEVFQREALRMPDNYQSRSAKPGHSEHQLGTTYDVAWAGLTSDSLDPRNLELFHWLEENAHTFGFIISYPYKEISVWPYHNRLVPVLTEYIYEPWHLRYVGEKLAQEMWEQGYLEPLNPILPQDFFTPWP